MVLNRPLVFCVVLDGDLYRVTVYNGNNAVDDGESVIASMAIDKSLKEEYRRVQ